jgi:hypothetical protein
MPMKIPACLVRPLFPLALAGLACACSPAPSATAPSAGSTAPASDAGATPEAAAPRPFASTPVEAQTLIQDQIEAHIKPLWKCVDGYRTAKSDPHRAVTVDVGIDQEGNLLGLTTMDPKQHDPDPTLKDCMWKALLGLPFPRSHAGVITVRQSFTDTTITQ